jgi:glycosyltransferase involved in cell wall biosynthesis
MWTFKRFVEKGYDAYLLLHTNAYARFPQGYDLITWRRMLHMEKHIIFPRYDPILKPVSNQTLAKLYSAADVYVQNSDAEGYAMPLAEALRCATPLIAPLNSAMSELVTGHGWGVECIPFEVYHEIPVYVPLLTCYPKPDQRSLLEKLEEAYNCPEKRKAYGKAGRKFVMENYNWDLVMKKWFKVLDSFQQEQEFFKQIGLCLGK